MKLSANSLILCPDGLKKAGFFLVLLLAPLFFYAQSLTGLWIGALSNDSTTVRKDQSFEIALTEYKGKVYGYSRSEFIVDDVLYYIVKRVKGTIEGDVCEVEDEEIVAYNFPGKLDKGVKVISTFYRNKADSTWQLSGSWKTNKTKKFYAVSGKVALQEEKDLGASKIFPHLEELKLADQVAFYKDRKEGIPVVRIAKPENKTSTVFKTPEQLPGGHNTMPLVKNHPGMTASQPQVSVSTATIPATTTASDPVVTANNPNKQPSSTDDGAVTKQPVVKTAEKNTISTAAVADNTTKPTAATTKKSDPVLSSANTQAPPVVKNSPEKKTAPVNSPVGSSTVPQQPTAILSGAPAVAINKEPVVSTAPAATKANDRPDVRIAAAVIGGRKSEFNQEVNFKSDSLQLSLYDNGEIDGDTVSVYLNGQLIMEKQGLKSSAIRKTIYLNRGKDDEFTLVLFAENLGKYPPNTGLLVVRDGDDIYNLRFSADLQKNAGVVFRRKN